MTARHGTDKTVACRGTSKREDNAGIGITGDRSCFTLSDTGTTEITACSIGGGLCEKTPGERGRSSS